MAEHPLRNEWTGRTELRTPYSYLLLALASYKERMVKGPGWLKYEVLEGNRTRKVDKTHF